MLFTIYPKVSLYTTFTVCHIVRLPVLILYMDHHQACIKTIKGKMFLRVSKSNDLQFLPFTYCFYVGLMTIRMWDRNTQPNNLTQNKSCVETDLELQ